MLSDLEQDIVSRGLSADDLLQTTELADLIKSLTVEAFAVFTETKPDELSKREDAYNLQRGLQAIEQELLHRVQQKDEIVRRVQEAEADENNPDQDDLPFDEDDGLGDNITIQGD
jgi:hypothetical protein